MGAGKGWLTKTYEPPAWNGNMGAALQACLARNQEGYGSWQGS